MNLYCTKCGEPWERDSFHEVANDTGREFGAVRRQFTAVGCSALSGVYFGDVRCNPNGDRRRADLSGVLFDLLGDDVDGVASFLDDLGGLL